jgi:hypothetical protein
MGGGADASPEENEAAINALIQAVKSRQAGEEEPASIDDQLAQEQQRRGRFGGDTEGTAGVTSPNLVENVFPEDEGKLGRIGDPGLASALVRDEAQGVLPGGDRNQGLLDIIQGMRNSGDGVSRQVEPAATPASPFDGDVSTNGPNIQAIMELLGSLFGPQEEDFQPSRPTAITGVRG